MATEAAQLFVTVSADVDKGVRALNSVNDSANKTGGFLKGAAQHALGFAAGLGLLNGGAAVFGAIKGGAIDMNAELETSTLQFTTLMGNADAARKHVEGLFDFAAKTPFETGPIIEASRIMRTFGGDALDSKKNLTLFGDAAAATNAPINEVAFWMSRAYASIQAGKPWGEAAQRLGELGIVTPQVRSKLEAMQASGASGAQVWAGLTGSLGKFSGAMEKQAGTFDGMLSTFTDGVNMMLAKALHPLFDALKSALSGVNALMASPAFNGAIEAIGNGIASTFTAIANAVGFLWKVIGPLVQALGYIIDVLVSGDDVASGLGETIGNLGEKFSDLANTVLSAVTGALESVMQQIPAFADQFFAMATAAIDAFVAMAPGLVNAVLNFLQGALDWLLNTGIPMAADVIGQLAVKFIDWVGPAAEKLAAALPGIAAQILEFLGANLPIIAGKLVEWGGAFIGWIAKNVLPRLPGALATIAGAIFGWLASTAASLIGKAGDMGRQFVESFVKWVGTIPSQLATIFGQVISTILGWTGSLVSNFGTVAVKMGKAFANGIVDLIEGAVNAVIRGLNSFQIHFGGLDLGPLGQVARIDWNGFQLGYVHLPRFLSGTMDTGSRSGLAILDPHEAVLPRRTADQFRQGDIGGDGPSVTVIIQGDYYATDQHVDDLSEKIASRVRLSTPRRTVTVGGR